MREPVLEVEGLEVHYGNVAALKGVSLTVGHGELVTLIGANGAGKTTLLRTISGLLRPTAGTIRLHGQPIHTLPPETIARLGVQHVPEGRRIFPELTVDENLRIGGLLLSDRRRLDERVAAMYALFPALADRKRAPGASLSGGEQQMLAFARALVSEPRILLLDEPSLGLAPALVQDVARLIGEFRAQGLTILLVEQNANLALRLADRGYVMEIGRITTADSAANLLASSRLREAYLGRRSALESAPGSARSARTLHPDPRP
jgi:branched-chain amino acid transport system ATP-binding protein